MKNAPIRQIKSVVGPAKYFVWGPRLAERWRKIPEPKGEAG